jgi:hypothetical protein
MLTMVTARKGPVTLDQSAGGHHQFTAAKSHTFQFPQRICATRKLDWQIASPWRWWFKDMCDGFSQRICSAG